MGQQETPLTQQQGSSLQHQAALLGQHEPSVVYLAPTLDQQEPFGVHQANPLQHQGSSVGQSGTPSSQLEPMQQPGQTQQALRDGSVVTEGCIVMAKAPGFPDFWPAKVS